jgi:hypothetical protein
MPIPLPEGSFLAFDPPGGRVKPLLADLKGTDLEFLTLARCG